jgi:hypothetical protein
MSTFKGSTQEREWLNNSVAVQGSKAHTGSLRPLQAAGTLDTARQDHPMGKRVVGVSHMTGNSGTHLAGISKPRLHPEGADLHGSAPSPISGTSTDYCNSTVALDK